MMKPPATIATRIRQLPWWLWLVVFLLTGIIASNLGWWYWRASLPPSQRNPFLHYGWPEMFLGTTPRQTGERLVVLVANSQGYGWEVADRQTYAAHLQARLSSESNPVRVVNWSIPGARYNEYALALAAARRLQPDTILVSLNPQVFDGAIPDRAIRRWTSDSFALLADPDIDAALPAPVRARMTDRSLDLRIAAYDLWPAYRIRTLPAALLGDQRFLRPLFERQQSGMWFRYAPMRGMVRRPPPDARTLVMDPRLVTDLLDLATSAAPRTVVIYMPFRDTPAEAVDLAWRTIARDCADRSITTADLSRAIGADGFLTGAHLSEAGHRAMANALAEILP